MSQQKDVKNIFNANLVDGQVVIHIGSGNSALVSLAHRLLSLEIDNWLLAAQMQNKAKQSNILVPTNGVSSKLMEDIRG